MGYAVRVDGDHLDAAAGELVSAAEALEGAAEGIARALGAVATGGGGGLLAGAAQEAAGRWRRGLRQVAAHGRTLSVAVSEARSDYVEVERLLTGGWARGPWTGLVP